MNRLYIMMAGALALATTVSSCSDSKSYAELLNEENRCVNLFLSQHRVVDHIPEGNAFEVGPDAPYYCLDEDQNVYMQVLAKGTDEKPEKDDMVYFRFIRYSLQYYIVGSDDNVGVGNANNMGAAPTYFLFDDYYTTQSAQYGEGIQLPMKYLGYDCKVNLVVKSQAGAESEMSYVVPYLYTISYYKPAL